jgi:hypothetical protein
MNIKRNNSLIGDGGGTTIISPSGLSFDDCHLRGNDSDSDASTTLVRFLRIFRKKKKISKLNN